MPMNGKTSLLRTFYQILSTLLLDLSHFRSINMIFYSWVVRNSSKICRITKEVQIVNSAQMFIYLGLRLTLSCNLGASILVLEFNMESSILLFLEVAFTSANIFSLKIILLRDGTIICTYFSFHKTEFFRALQFSTKNDYSNSI